MTRRAILFTVLFSLLTSCSPGYKPESFRSQIDRLIDEGAYGQARRLVDKADPEAQAKFDGSGYLAVAEDLIFLPGIDEGIYYEPDRDWCFPGTSDAIEDKRWQDTATAFAKKYNQIRHKIVAEDEK